MLRAAAQTSDRFGRVRYPINGPAFMILLALRVRGFFAAGCFGIFLLAGAAFAQSNDVAPIDFDIPTQSLVSALDAYSAKTGIIAVYDGRLAGGRLSGSVRGRFTPSAALGLLLAATGLTAQYTSKDALVLLPASKEEAAIVTTPSSIGRTALARMRTTEEQQYSGLVQFAIARILCTENDTRPGDYRLAMNFRIGPSGEITGVKLLGSTGDQQRDAAILRALESEKSVGASPPPAMAQPFTMIMLPRSSGGVVDCPVSGQQNG